MIDTDALDSDAVHFTLPPWALVLLALALGCLLAAGVGIALHKHQARWVIVGRLPQVTVAAAPCPVEHERHPSAAPWFPKPVGTVAGATAGDGKRVGVGVTKQLASR